MTCRLSILRQLAVGFSFVTLACSSEPSDDGAAGSGGGPMNTGGSPTFGGAAPGTAGAQSGMGMGGAQSGSSGAPGLGGSSAGGQAPGGSGGMKAGAGGSGMSSGGAQAGSGMGGARAGSGGKSGGSGGATMSSGCGKAPPASNRYSMDVGGLTREYILYVPTDYDQNKPYPLVFAWHPLGGSAQSTAGNGNGGYYGLRGASAGGAILVSPEGLNQQGETSGSKGWWNSQSRDINFAKAMIDRFKSEMCIDDKRIFSTGFSFGGMMSFAVGCSGLARAIAPMAGSGISGCANGTTQVAVMGFHGVNDSVVGISGGRMMRDEFVERNQCMTQTMPTTPSWCDGINQNQQPCTCVSYQGCSAGYPVTWCEFNADHTPAPNSATTIWNFFSQF